MKVHAGVDAGSGYVHTITGTAANVHDIAETVNLLREDDEVCYGDSGYSGVEKRPEIQENEHFRNIEFRTYQWVIMPNCSFLCCFQWIYFCDKMS